MSGLMMKFGGDSSSRDLPNQEFSILKSSSGQSDEDDSDEIRRQLQDEKFRRQEERRKANIQFKETDT